MGSSGDEEANMFAMKLVSASALPMVLKAAIELDLFEMVARAGPGAFLSPEDIAAQLPTTNPEAPAMLDRMLRLLATYSILTYSLRTSPQGHVHRLYGLGPVCKFFVKNEDGVSAAPVCLMLQDKVLMETWYHLKDAVLDGSIPFNKAYGMSAFEYFGTDPRISNVFNTAMSNSSTIIMKKILETYNGFEGLSSVVDVGGGTGTFASMVVSKYPSIEAINFDLPHVIKDAPPYPRVHHVGGDMFATIPKGDAIFMKWICHDWSDQHCLKFLKKCHEALPEDGKVIVAECMLSVAPDTSAAGQGTSHSDIVMLVTNPGGKERTEKEFEALAIGAGFKTFRVVCNAFSTYIMEFLKN